MQRPTCTKTSVRTVADAHTIFYAVLMGILPRVTRRLNPDERQYIQAGAVFVWVERDTSAEEDGVGSADPCAFSDLIIPFRSLSGIIRRGLHDGRMGDVGAPHGSVM